jgi:uncharacterized protein (DUF433 family)
MAFMIYDDRYLEVNGLDDIRIAGTRVGLEHVLAAYESGSLAEEIAMAFPTITLEQVHGVIAWYLRNRSEAELYLHRQQELARRAREEQASQQAPDVIVRLRHLAEERVAG